MAQPDPQWEDFVRREPFFAVLPTDAHRAAAMTPAGEDAFFATGEACVAWMLEMIAPLSPGFAPASVLDYGCGIGRLTFPLSWRIRSVTAVDRSPAMLQHARHYAARRGVEHVTWLSPDELNASSQKFDLVVCQFVLQRLAPTQGLALLRALLGRIGPGGVGVFQFPYRNTTSPLVGASRWLREHVPAFNRLAGRLRGKPAHDPFIPTHAYALDDVLGLLRDAAMDATLIYTQVVDNPPTHAVFSRAPLVMRGPLAAARPAAPDPDVTPASVAGAGAISIDVRDLIAHTSIDDLNRTAETYFSTLTDWSFHLAKPFAKAEGAPQLLIDVAVLLQGLRLDRGTRVLDFGAGSGWLSRWLTQLGCAVTLVDVSPTALDMARDLYRRLPIIDERGDIPVPAFLLFDGHRIDLPDGSVDRIVSFHAFHHTVNPDEILREFGRVLTPGGVAAFAEPGPHHSTSPLAQFEMRTFGVVENDIDVHAIWKTAQDAGFVDLKLAVYHEPPFFVSIDEFDDLLTGGATNERWTSSTRVFLRNHRNFFLTKGGEGTRDSGATEGLACLIAVELAGPAVADRPITVDAVVTNSGTVAWLPWDAPGSVAIGAHLYDHTGAILNFDFHCESPTDPPREIRPGETVRRAVSLPSLEPGRYRLEFDCVAAGVIWFAQVGSKTVALEVEVR